MGFLPVSNKIAIAEAVLRQTDFGWIYVADQNRGGIAAREGTAAYAASRKYLGIAPPPFAILDAEIMAQWDPPTDIAAYPWQFATEDLRADGETQRPMHNAILRHEIGHGIFRRHIMQEKPSDIGYGTSAPDWLDETIAVLFESGSSRSRRLRFAREAVRKQNLIPLAIFLSMTHPQYDTVLRIAQNRRANSGELANPAGKSQIITGKTAQITALFYAQCLGFGEFLINRANNNEIIAMLAIKHKEGYDLEPELLKITRANDIENLEEDFRDWLKSAR